MYLIAIDGACRFNGKPHCVSIASAFIQRFDDELKNTYNDIKLYTEVRSTSQRGELYALLLALIEVSVTKQESLIVTDSEYVFKAMRNDWYSVWERNNWITQQGTKVKNKDIWDKIYSIYFSCISKGIEINFVHIKGHCIPFGKVTAKKILTKDSSGRELYIAANVKYKSLCDTTKKSALQKANKLSVENNGFELSPIQLCTFVCSNMVADLSATVQADATRKTLEQCISFNKEE